MNVYSIRFDSDAYCSLMPEKMNIWSTDQLRFSAHPKSLDWEIPSFRISNPILPAGDFIGIGPGCIGVKEDVATQLLDFFERSGELLPVYPNGLGFLIFNVTECWNCLDHENTEWIRDEDTQFPLMIDRYYFVEEMLPEASIFKIPETVSSEILVHDGHTDSKDTFMHWVKELNLKGLCFDLIWSSDPEQNSRIKPFVPWQ